MELGLAQGFSDWGSGDDPIDVARQAEQAGFDLVWLPASTSPGVLRSVIEQTERIRLALGDPLALGEHGPSASSAVPSARGAPPMGRTQDRLVVGADYGEGALVRIGGGAEVWMAAESADAVSRVCEMADGWLPSYYSPWRAEIYHDQIEHRSPGFVICATTLIEVATDVERALMAAKAMLVARVEAAGSRIGDPPSLLARMGLVEVEERILELLADGKRAEALEVVPTEFVDELSLVGSVDRIKDRLQAWDESAVTMITVTAPTALHARRVAELLRG